MRKSLLLLAVVSAPAFAQQRPEPRADSVVGVAKQALGTLRDAATLRQAGWNSIGFGGGVKDLSPFQGQHWINGQRFFLNPPVQLTQPNFLMYLALGDSLIPIGVAYTRRISIDAPVPDSLAGRSAEWHVHQFCSRVPGEGNVLADGPEDCAFRGGIPAPNKIAMIHTWTIPNPDGPYAHDNPALPFIATGLKAPASATRDDRLFAIALGETYGAKLFIAHRIERDLRRQNAAHEGLEKLERIRFAMRLLVPDLRRFEQQGDTKKFNVMRQRLIMQWNELADQYRALARTPEIKARFDHELSTNLDRPHKHM